MNRIFQFLKKYEWQAFALLLVFAAIYKYLSSSYGTGWKFAAGYSYILFALFTIWAFVKKEDMLFKMVILFAIVAGFTELVTDWWLVSVKDVLVYHSNEPMIIDSPLYMPFSWAVVFIQVGFLGWLFGRGKSFRYTVISTAIIGLLFIPFFEHLAKEANWWYYQNSKMIWDVPYYVITSEVAVSLALPFFFRWMEARKSYLFAILFGIVQGLWIWVSCMVGYFLLN